MSFEAIHELARTKVEGWDAATLAAPTDVLAERLFLSFGLPLPMATKLIEATRKRKRGT